MMPQLTACALVLVLAPLSVAGGAAAPPLGGFAGVFTSIFGSAATAPSPDTGDESDNPFGIYGSVVGGPYGNLSEALDAYYNATAAINDMPLKAQKQIYAALEGTNTTKLTGQPLIIYQQYEAALAELNAAEGPAPSSDYDYAEAPEGDNNESDESDNSDDNSDNSNDNSDNSDAASPAEAKAIASHFANAFKGLGDTPASASQAKQAVSQALQFIPGRKLKDIGA